MISVALLFFFLMIILLPIVHANPLSMGLAGTYQNNAPPGSLDGARGMQVDAVRSIAFVSSNTDASLTAINFSNPFNLSVYGSVTNAAPPGSLDGIWFGTLDLATNIFYAPSATDSTTAWYNISTGTFVFLNDTAADTAGAGSQQGEYDVVIVNTGSTKWLLTGGTTDSYVSSFNVTNPRVRPTVVGSFTDTSGACTVRGLTQMYNIPGTTLVVVASTTSSYVTVLNVSAAGAITCIGSGYTDTAGAGSIQGFTSFFYENSTGYLYVPGTTDSYLTILTNITTGTPTLVGSVGGLTTITSVAVSPTDFNGKKYAFVGSTSAGRGISIVDVTNPAAPTIAGNFNQTSGTCVYNGVYSLRALGNYLYATSSADACFYAIKLIDDPTNITLSSPYDGYYNDTDIFVNLTFTAAVSDTDGLVNCSLWTNYSGVWSLNQTQSVGGVSNVTSFNLTGLTNTTFIWNIECHDIFSHSTFSAAANTVTLNWTDTPPSVALSSPINGYTNSVAQFVNLTFNATVSDDHGLVNCSLWTNYSGVWSLNQTQSVGGVSNVTSFNLTDLTNKTFVWNIQCFDNGLQSTFASTNRTVTLNWNPAVDTPPAVSLSSPPAGYTNDTAQFVNITFTAIVSDDLGLVNCSLWTNYSGVWSLNQTQSVGGVSNSTSFTLNNLSNTTFIWNIQCFDNGLHSTFGSTNRTVILNWTPPLVGNFSVQTYFISLGSGVSSGFIPFIGGQTDFNAVPFVTMRMSATTPNWNYFLPDVYFNSTGIIVTRNGGTGAVMDLNINVVQFDPATVRVQSGIFTLGAGSTSATASIGSPVDLSRAALLFYYNTTSGSTIYNSNTVMGNISDVNQLNFSVAGTVGTKSGHWYVFESLDGGFSVQKTTLNFASSDTSATGTISFIDTGKTFLIASYITSEAQDDPRDGSLYVALTDSTTVTGTRLGVPVATLNANVYAITFSGNVNVQRGYFSYAAGTGTASATVSTFNLNNSMAWNPVLTSRMADSSTTTAIESSFQLLNLSSSTTIDGSRSETAGAAGGEWEIIDWIPLHAPTVDSMTVDDGLAPSGEVILSAGSTRPVNCTIAASDIEGASAIMNASATFYYYLNKSSDPNDNTVHYTNASCSVVGSNATSKIFFCAFDVYYYANNGTWNCNATVYNIYSYFSSSNASVTIDPLYAVHLTDGLNFGPVEAGFSSSEFATNITNLGNMPLNITVQGYAQTPGDAMGMNCSDLTNISISAIGFSGTSGSFTSKTLLTGAVQMTNLQLSKQTSALPINQSVYWQIVPTPAVGSSTRTCEGYIIFSGETQ